MKYILLVVSLGLLGYVGFVWLDTQRFQQAESLQLKQQMQAPVTRVAALSLADQGGLIGRMEIPRLGISTIVMEGTTNATLRHALGHIAGTALPGMSGNVGISGHRDTFFRPLRHVEANDVITLTTTSATYRYRVLTTEIVSPDDVAVLTPTTGETLTLVTCYPFYFVGPAPQRFIVHGERVL
jgi:sortase A